MRNKGQNLIEFLIIVAVVAVGGILALTLLGGNINETFSKSTQNVAEFKPFGDGESTSSSTTSPASPTSPTSPTTPTTPTTPSSTTSVNGVDIEEHGDGSVSFTYNGQDVALDSAMMDNLNVVFGTTGSEGLTTEVMAAVQKLIDEHVGEYSPADVPIDISFAKGIRHLDGTYEGDATYNQISASVGEHSIYIQNDQTISGGAIKENMGIYTVEKYSKEGNAKVSGPEGSYINGKTLVFTDFQNAHFEGILDSSWNFPPGTPTSI